MTANLIDIEKSAKAYAKDRNKLAQGVLMLNHEIERLRRKHLPAIKEAVGIAAQSHAELKALLEASPELFVKPKTLVIHGVKVGFAKGKGKIEFDDPEKVILLIRKHLEDQADVLITTKEVPAKDALANLSVADLKRIGCTVIEAGDQVVIKPTDSEVDKLVTALLKDATDEVQE